VLEASAASSTRTTPREASCSPNKRANLTRSGCAHYAWLQARRLRTTFAKPSGESSVTEPRSCNWAAVGVGLVAVIATNRPFHADRSSCPCDAVCSIREIQSQAGSSFIRRRLSGKPAGVSLIGVRYDHLLRRRKGERVPRNLSK
jgi:hypothetical protein